MQLVASRVPAQGPSTKPKTKLIGDVAFAEGFDRAAAVTPVPGRVGPMTIAMLMSNTLAMRKAGLKAQVGSPFENSAGAGRFAQTA
jgi:methylenetetrahydrofolate dehydrogenase (NADP+) / methenyltetrahydrofolate cyclohydrolase